MKWHRRPFGYVSSDLQWFLERGARMAHGANAWLVWRRATKEEIAEHTGEDGYHYFPIRSFKEISGASEGDVLFIDTKSEGGWLSEAKEIVGGLR